jgi:hypothetical protein
MEHESSLPQSQESSMCSYTEPDLSLLFTHLRFGLLSCLFPSGFPTITYMRSSSAHFELYALPISSLAKSTNHEATHYAAFFPLPTFQPASVQISTSATCSQSPSFYVPPLMLGTKFHNHTEAETRV